LINVSFPVESIVRNYAYEICIGYIRNFSVVIFCHSISVVGVFCFKMDKIIFLKLEW